MDSRSRFRIELAGEREIGQKDYGEQKSRLKLRCEVELKYGLDKQRETGFSGTFEGRAFKCDHRANSSKETTPRLR
jgi:hypothetical protein